MTKIIAPERYQMLIDLHPYFDDEECLKAYNDEDLQEIWVEMVFTRYHKDVILEIQS